MTAPTPRNYNNVTSSGTLSSPAAPGDATLITTGLVNYPSVPFTAAVDRNTPAEEIVLVTLVNSGVLTVTRGYDGTAAQTHLAGATVEHVAVARDFREANQHTTATSGVHGTTGELVGAEGAQTISDKTLVSPVLEADLTDGDAFVAVIPTGAESRNLARGVKSNGADGFIIDSSGNATFNGHSVTGMDTRLTTVEGQAATIASKADSSTVTGINTRLTTAEGTLSAATASPTNNTVVKRDGSGRFQAAAPSAAADVAVKSTTDALSTRITTLESGVGDTGWQTVSPGAGWADGGAKYRVKDGIAYYRPFHTRASWTGSTTVTTLPSACWPSVSVSFVTTWQGSFYEIAVSASGVVTTFGSGSGGVVGLCSWPVG